MTRLVLVCVLVGVLASCGGSASPGAPGDASGQDAKGDSGKGGGGGGAGGGAGGLADAAGDTAGDAKEGGAPDLGGDAGEVPDAPAEPALDAPPDLPADLPVDPPPPDGPIPDGTGTCGASTDCTGGMVCRMGMCSGCLANGECASGNVCDSSDMRCKPGCDANPPGGGACPAGGVCCGSGAVCILSGSIGTCTPGDCLSTADCAGGKAGMICIDNTCSPCGLSSQCPAGEYCNSSSRCEPGCDATATSGGCPAGKRCCPGTEICNTSTHTCGACTTAAGCIDRICSMGICVDCTSDGQCSAAPPAGFGAGYLCIGGKCTMAECKTEGVQDLCATGEICCSMACHTGDCCSDAECTGPLAGFVCTGNQCVCPTPTGDSIYVDVAKGSNTTGNGSIVCPFKTITKGLMVATAGKTVAVAAGTYNAAAGETFPLTLKAGVTVSGASAATVSVVAVTGGFAMLVAVPEAVVEKISLTNTGGGGRGIQFNTGAIASSILRDAIVSGCDGRGVEIRGTSAPTIGPTVEVSANGAEGILVRDTAKPAIGMAVINGNTDEGVLIGDSAEVSIDASGINANGASGIEVANDGRLTLTGSTLDANDDGITFVNDSNGSVRTSTVRGNVNHGVFIDSTLQPDLGTVADAGGNTFGGTTLADNNGGTAVCNNTGNTIEARENLWSACPTPLASMPGSCDNDRDVGNAGGGSILTSVATCGP